MLDDFNDFMTDTITIEPFSSRDGYGTASYGAAVTYACRVDGLQKQVVDATGVERISTAKIYLMGTPAIGPTDRLTLPASFTPQQPPILSVNPLTDESGAHHLEITV
jgi:hypothetical protein